MTYGHFIHYRYCNICCFKNAREGGMDFWSSFVGTASKDYTPTEPFKRLKRKTKNTDVNQYHLNSQATLRGDYQRNDSSITPEPSLKVTMVGFSPQRRGKQISIQSRYVGEPDLAHQDSTIACASDFGVDRAKLPNGAKVLGHATSLKLHIASDLPSHPRIAMHHCFVLSQKSLAISRVSRCRKRRSEKGARSLFFFRFRSLFGHFF